VLKLADRLAARTIPVRVLWPDGKPVAEANVWLSQVNDPTAVVATAVGHTATDGTFDLVGLEDIDYVLHADKYAGLARVSCAKNVLVPARGPVAQGVELSLTITDFDVCKKSDFEKPAEVGPQE